MTIMNRVFLVGNITGDIYFDHLLIKGKRRPFLRLILMSHRPRLVKGLRINLWDEKAELYFPYLQRGSRIAVVGNILSRDFKGSVIHEVEALNLILLRNINWEYGEQERARHQFPQPSASANNVFVIGKISEDIYFDWLKHGSGDGSFAFLRLILSNEQYLDGLRVNVLGSLAELVFPYLKKDSKIAIDGHFQTRDQETGKRVVEVTAEHITFLEGVDWSSGAAAQEAHISEPIKEVEK
jgi:single-stranded DNA-binding protein